ncbi:MAG: hypothetical protein NZ533_03530 [Casimicrobiaceae bacterium]|nr:hypothetical protein [Casimicrobiaceae bacterium]MDW8311775.1 hypothetical protein [Burkholderiales bacterium]
MSVVVSLIRWFAVVFGAAGVLFVPTARAEVIGYAVGNVGGTSTLYRIDFNTGEAWVIGATGTSKIEGLALSPEGQLYGVNPASAQLLRCATTSGACSVVGTLTGVTPTVNGNAGLAFGLDGRLYLGVNGALYRVDPNTAAATSVGATGVALGGLAQIAPQPNCPSGLYGLGSNTDRGKLFCLNPNTGAATTVATLSGLSPVDGGLDGLSDGNLLYAVADNGSSASQIFRIAPDKLVAEDIRPVTLQGAPVTGLESLAVAPLPEPLVPHSSEAYTVPTLAAVPLALLGVLLGLSGMLGLRRAARRAATAGTPPSAK